MENCANAKIRVVCIFGTRPEAVKMSPLVNRLKKRPEFETIVITTAQHREMLDSVLKVFNIKPDADLNIMEKSQTLTGITTKVLMGLDDLLYKFKPDIVLVHGDTATTFAGALSAFYHGAKIGHVEAGLRTYNKREPYPEEINRRLTANLADLHFAPTSNSKNNLICENIPENNIYVTGNTEIDAIFDVTSKNDNYVFLENILNNVNFDKKVITMTAHRKENLGKPMESIFKGLKRIVTENHDCLLVYPVHLNPEVRKVAYSVLGNTNRVFLIEPLGISDMYNLISRSYIVATDSGGIQESAPALNKPCVVLRNVTERPEGVDSGVLALAGTKQESVYSVVDKLLHDSEYYNKMSAAKNPFGDGKASDRIISAILHDFKFINDRPEEFLS